MQIKIDLDLEKSLKNELAKDRRRLKRELKKSKNKVKYLYT